MSGLLVALGLVGVGSLAVVPSAVAAPDDGLSETTAVRYDVDGTGPVEVTVTATIVNTTPDSGSYYYYFDEYSVLVPDSAEGLVATSRGSALPLTLEPSEEPGFSFSVASFGDLLYGQERQIVWTYTLPGDPIRSDGYSRVGPGYATFDVIAHGDTDQVSIEIVTPTTMTFDSTWDGFTSSVVNGKRVHRTTESQDAYGTYAYVSMRDPDQADTSEVTVGDTTLTVSSFPGDDEWGAFVTEQVEAGLPLLEETMGHPWPGGVDTIREDVSPEVLGYAWFDPGNGEIVVSEELDAATLMHELSHAWMNDSTVSGRWLYEGLSEFLGQRVATATAGEQETYSTPSREDPDALPLTEWAELDFSDSAEATDKYAYPASYTAMTALLGELDDEALADVVSAVYDGESAYAGPDGDDVGQERTDWQRFLDLLEARPGVVNAEEVYRTWVLDSEQQGLLDARTPARETYAAIDEADAEWLPPLGLRVAMTDWAFDDAATVSAALGADGSVVAAGALAGTAGELQAVGEETGLGVPGTVRETYEEADSAEDYTALEALLPQAVEVVGEVGEASEVAADGGNPFGEIGQALLSVDEAAGEAREALAEGDLGAADAAAATATSRAEIAPWLGGGLVFVLLAAVAGAVLLIVRARRRPAPAAAGGQWIEGQVGFSTAAGSWSAAAHGALGDGSPPTPYTVPAALDSGIRTFHGASGTEPSSGSPHLAGSAVPALSTSVSANLPAGHELPSAWQGSEAPEARDPVQ